ncbi:DUF5715 family protein [Silvibacterium acidisoli]|uniref:DUF5715 family protein n=1 Tax=Acidobacteriaceae bacterium ZG23-2 TaxID=2883246 RepID=UPI00406BF4C6
MRRIQLVVVLALVFGLAMPAVAVTKHSRLAPKRAVRRARAVSSHHTAHPVEATLAVRRRNAATPRHLSAHERRRRHQAVAVADASVPEQIDPVPVQRVRMDLLPLVGTHASLVRQNVRTEADGLDRIEDDAELNSLRASKALVLLPASYTLRVNDGLPMNRRYTRPWTAKFLSDLSRAHYARFHRPLQVNSAVRTVAYQRHLLEINGNAAPADGDIASPHLTGAAVDIAKKGLSVTEIAWMRGYLFPLQAAGKLDVEEEFYQSCFHISVYRSYAPAAVAKPHAPARHNAGLLVAARVR